MLLVRSAPAGSSIGVHDRSADGRRVAVFRKGEPALPAAYMHTSFPGATNIWTAYAAELARRTDMPEDKRRLDHLVRAVVQGVKAVSG